MATPAQTPRHDGRPGPRVLAPMPASGPVTQSPPQPSPAWPRVVMAVAGWLSLTLGILVMVGWHTGHILSSTTFMFESVPVRYNAGLCFALGGMALLLFARNRIASGRGAAAPLALIALLTLCEYLFSVDIGIDHLFFGRQHAPPSIAPRMAPNTAVCFGLLGGILLLSSRQPRRWRNTVQAFVAALVAALGLAGFVGYMADIPTAYGWGKFTPMAAPTAAAMVVLGFGMIAFAWRQYTAAGAGMPPWSPLLAAMTLAAGSAALWQALHVLHPNSSLDLLALVVGLLQAALLYLVLHLLRGTRRRATQLRQLNSALHLQMEAVERVERELREKQAYTRSLIEASLDPLVTIAPDGKITDVNAATEEVTGVGRDQLIGSDFSNYFTQPDKARAGYRQVFAEGQVQDYALAIRHSSGRVTDVLYNASVFRNQAGEAEGVFAAARDITERKKLEQELRERQAYTRSLIEASLDPLVTIAPDGSITDVNAATEAATGRSRQELIGTDFCDYFTQPEKARAGYQRGFREGSVRDYELEIRHHDGHVVPVLYNASVYHDAAGQVIGVFAAARDISERRRTDEALKKNEERYRALVVASAQIVWTTPADGMVDDMPMWREYTGQTPAEVRGWGWLEAVHPDDRERTTAAWSQAVASGALHDVEFRIRRRDGQYRHFAIRGVPVLEEDGRVREWIGTCSDIHERKRIEDELRQQASLLSLAHDAILVCDLQYRIMFWNRGAEETYGWSAKEAVGRLAPELLHTEFPLPLPEIRAAVQQQGEWEGELKHVTRDGRSIVVASRWSLQRDHHGSSANILEISRDISERKRLEEELRLNRERLLLAQKIGRSGTFDWDIRNNINSWSPEIEELYGLQPGAFAGTFEAWEALVWPSDLEMARAAIAGSLKSGEFQGEWRIARPSDGQVRWLDARAKVLFDESGQPAHMVGINIDITERKRLEESLRQRTLELENSVAELETFSYSVSHDLRAPLRSIDGFSQILLEDYRDKVDAEGQDCLRRIRVASQNMGQLIDALLQLSRVMRAELSREPVDLTMLALSTAAVVQKAEPERRVQFHITNALQARGDRRLLGVLLQNLLQNAWKFTARTPEPRIEFGSTQKDGALAFYVRDNGIGFDMTYVGKLFTPFQRLHAKEQFEGTGIGLATVQRIIKRHGGRVWAEGAVGKGATFYFSLN